MLRFKINFITGNMKETLRCVSSDAVLLVDGEAQERGLRDSEMWAWPASNQQVLVAASPALPVTPSPDLTAAWWGRNGFFCLQRHSDTTLGQGVQMGKFGS